MKHLKYSLLCLLLFICFLSGCNLLEKKHYIVFVTNCETNLEKIEITEDIILPKLEQENYTFAGWYIDEDLNTKVSNEYIASFNESSDLVLYAKWNIIETYEFEKTIHEDFFNVSFYERNENEKVVQKIQKGMSCKSYIPTKEGYIFCGWCTDSELTNEFDFETLIETDLSLYAKWEKQTFHVTYLDKNDEVYKDLIVEYGKTINIEDYPIVEGYNFIKWDYEITSVMENIIIKPIYEVQKYNISLYDNFTNLIKVVTKEYGTTLVKEELSFEYENYDLENYYTDSTFTSLYDFNDTITKPLRLYANYKIKTFTVDFYDSDSEILFSEQVAYGNDAEELKHPSKIGYDFIGWDKEIKKIKNNLEVYPIFNIQSFKVDFKANIENLRIDEQIVNYNNKAKIPTFSKLESHNFIGFFTDQTYLEEFDFEQGILSDTTVYLKFERKTFTVKFVIYDEEDPYDVQLIKYGESATTPQDPDIKEINFYNWIEDYSVVTSDLTVHANYETNYRMVAFNTNGGTSINTKLVLNGQSLNPFKAPTKEYYDFDGWYYDENLTTSYNLLDTITEDITLYAKWKIIEYEINYTLNGGLFTTNDYLKSFTINNFGDLIEPVKQDELFIGFYLTEYFDEETKINSINDNCLSYIDAISKTLNLYARWTDSLSYLRYEKFLYENHSDYVTIKTYLGNESTVYVPDSIQSLQVKEIDNDVFAGKSKIQNIYLPMHLSICYENTFGNLNVNLYFSNLVFENIPLSNYTNANLYLPMELFDSLDNLYENDYYYVNYFGEICDYFVESDEELYKIIFYEALNEVSSFNLCLNKKITKDEFASGFQQYQNRCNYYINLQSYNIVSVSSDAENNIYVYKFRFFYNTEDLASETTSGKYNFTQLDGFRNVQVVTKPNNRIFKIDSRDKYLYVQNSEQLFMCLQNGYKPILLNDDVKNLYEKARTILSEIISDDMTDLEKVYQIYTYLVLNVEYDYEIYDLMQTEYNMNKYDAFYLEGVINDKKAVCDGISKAFVLLCGIEGIQSIKVTGQSIEQVGTNIGHAWNKVCIDGDWYVVDCTSGNCLYIAGNLEILNYGYFLISDEIYLTNYIETGDYVLATGQYNIYENLFYPWQEENANLIVDSQEELNELLCYFYASEYESIDFIVNFDYGTAIKDELEIGYKFAHDGGYTKANLKETYILNMKSNIFAVIKVNE